MLADADRLQNTIEQVLRARHLGACGTAPQSDESTWRSWCAIA
jgi:hypothetical protein